MVTQCVSTQIVFIAIEAPARARTYRETGPSLCSVTDPALGKNGNWRANEVICRTLTPFVADV